MYEWVPSMRAHSWAPTGITAPLRCRACPWRPARADGQRPAHARSCVGPSGLTLTAHMAS